MKRLLKGFLLLLIVALVGCGGSSKYMKLVPPEEATNIKPDANNAMIVFMRPASLGFAIQSSVFELTDTEEKFVGIVSAKKKVAYLTPPGEKLFMVVGESADFAGAEVEAGKTYYMNVVPRMGFWKARFSLAPMTKDFIQTKKFAGWDNGCAFTENTEGGYKWATDNGADIKKKREAYYKKWMAKPAASRPFLRKEDGI